MLSEWKVGVKGLGEGQAEEWESLKDIEMRWLGQEAPNKKSVGSQNTRKKYVSRSGCMCQQLLRIK